MTEKVARRIIAVVLGICMFPVIISVGEFFESYGKAGDTLYENFFLYTAANYTKLISIFGICVKNELCVLMPISLFVVVIYKLWK